MRISKKQLISIVGLVLGGALLLVNIRRLLIQGARQTTGAAQIGEYVNSGLGLIFLIAAMYYLVTQATRNKSTELMQEKTPDKSIPLWMWVGGGLLILSIIIGAGLMLFLDSSRPSSDVVRVSKVQKDESGAIVRISTAPFNDADAPRPPAGTRSYRQYKSSPHLDRKDPPFEVDPVLSGKQDEIFLDQLSAFAYRGGPPDWSLGLQGNTGANQAIAPIRYGKKLVQRGLGMHPPSAGWTSVSFALGKKASRLTGEVGVSNDSMMKIPEPHFFVILGNGKELWRSRTMSGFKMQDTFDVDVSEVQLLELQVHCEGDSACVHAIWVDPVLKLIAK